MNRTIHQSLELLKAYLEKPALEERYCGYDPFDGLNSKFFKDSPLNQSRFFRLAWLQLNKTSPVNFRKIAKVETGYNPQALALFILGYSRLYRKFGEEKDLEIINFLSEKLIDSQSSGWSGSCWGYNFDWQARAFFQPAYTPMIVPTAYAVEALFEAFEILSLNKLKDTAITAAEFVLSDLNRTEKNGKIAFSYSPLDSTVVYNATLLASKLLAQVHHYSGENNYLRLAKASINYCIDAQLEDGSWPYGAKTYHQWIDNFHTGYNLECIKTYMDLSKDNSYEQNIQRGFEFYLSSFFLADGRSKYYSNKLYPIDIDNPAQLVITLSKLGTLNEKRLILERILKWTIVNMQSREGYFYYQKRRLFTNKISYMRWSQAWMFYALSTYLAEIDE